MVATPVDVLAAAVHNRRVSAVDVLQAHLEQNERINPRINAVVYLDAERALQRAQDIDLIIAKGGEPAPLGGVPFTAKVNLETSGIPTTLGVADRRLTEPDRDAMVVARMKAAGAILLGKTNLPPWGGGLETDSDLFGRTNSPKAVCRSECRQSLIPGAIIVLFRGKPGRG